MSSTKSRVIFCSSTQGKYDALSTKDPNTFYFCSDTKRMYLGDYEYTKSTQVLTSTPTSSTPGDDGRLYVYNGNIYLCQITSSGYSWTRVANDSAGSTLSSITIGDGLKTGSGSKTITSSDTILHDTPEGAETYEDDLVDQTLDHGDTFNIQGVSTDKFGHIIGVNKHTVKLPNQYTHPSSNVSPGTYRSVKVNEQGHVISGTNPTTLAGYGITDGATKSDVETAKQEAVELVLGEAVDANFDTLQEVAAWIASDTTNSAKLITRVTNAESEIDDIQSDLSQLSNPNLLVNPDFKINQRGQEIYTGQSYCKYTSDKWVYSTDRTDVSVTITNTGITLYGGTGGVYFNFTQVLENVKAGTYTLSAKVDNVSAIQQLLMCTGSVWEYNQDNPTDDDGDGIIFLTRTLTQDYSKFDVGLQVYEGKTVNVEWIKFECSPFNTPFTYPNPMEELLKCGIPDDSSIYGYKEKYATQSEVTEIGNNTAENLLPYPYFSTTYSSVGIDWVDNKDGTISLSGTSTNYSTFFLNKGDTTLFDSLEHGETYTISGVPELNTKYYIYMNYYKDGEKITTIQLDRGAGGSFVMDKENYDNVVFGLQTVPNVTIENITIKPMLEKGSVAHPYTPYNLSRKNLNKAIDKIYTDLDFGDIDEV